MSFPTVKSNPYNAGKKKRPPTKQRLWTDAQWAKLVKAAEDAAACGDVSDPRFNHLASVPPAIPVRCLRLIHDLCNALADTA